MYIVWQSKRKCEYTASRPSCLMVHGTRTRPAARHAAAATSAWLSRLHVHAPCTMYIVCISYVRPRSNPPPAASKLPTNREKSSVAGYPRPPLLQRPSPPPSTLPFTKAPGSSTPPIRRPRHGRRRRPSQRGPTDRGGRRQRGRNKCSGRRGRPTSRQSSR